MNTINDLHALTGAYAVDALDDLERARFERHLAECADCASEVHSLREAAAVLAFAVETGPPASLRDTVLEEIRTVRPLPPQPAPSEVVRRQARRSFRLAPSRLVAAAVAAVVVMVGGGIALDHRGTQAPAPVAVAQRVQDAADARSQSVGFPDGSKATLTHSASVGRAVLITQDMAPAPSGKAYELWFKKNGRMVPAGLMTGSGNQTVVLHGKIGNARWVGITVEPAAGSSTPTTTPIVEFDLSKAV